MTWPRRPAGALPHQLSCGPRNRIFHNLCSCTVYYVQLVVRMACSLGPGNMFLGERFILTVPRPGHNSETARTPQSSKNNDTRRRFAPYNTTIPPTNAVLTRTLIMFDCLKPSSHSHSWTRNSFPGGKACSSSMLFGPVLPVTGSPYMGAAALPAMTIPTSSPMVVPMQMSAPVQTGCIPVPVTVQQPSPVVQVLPPPVIQVTPSPGVAALPQTYTVLQTPQPAPHVPSPVIQSSIPVPQPSPPRVVQSIYHDHQDQQQQGSPGKYTVNLYVNTPEHRSRQLDDRSPSPTLPPRLLEQQQQWQQQQEQQQQLWQQQQQQLLQQWQERQLYQQQQWQQQQQQLQQRGRPQSARPPTAQPPTPSSLNISIFGPQPRHPGSPIYLQTPTPPPR